MDPTERLEAGKGVLYLKYFWWNTVSYVVGSKGKICFMLFCADASGCSSRISICQSEDEKAVGDSGLKVKVFAIGYGRIEFTAKLGYTLRT